MRTHAPAANCPEREIRRVCNGSELDSNVGYAFTFGEHDQYTHRQRVAKATLVYVAELQAAVSALLLHDPEVDMHIFTDSKAIHDALRDPNPLLTETPNGKRLDTSHARGGAIPR